MNKEYLNNYNLYKYPQIIIKKLNIISILVPSILKAILWFSQIFSCLTILDFMINKLIITKI